VGAEFFNKLFSPEVIEEDTAIIVLGLALSIKAKVDSYSPGVVLNFIPPDMGFNSLVNVASDVWTFGYLISEICVSCVVLSKNRSPG
jgi:hypothetical protein